MTGLIDTKTQGTYPLLCFLGFHVRDYDKSYSQWAPLKIPCVYTGQSYAAATVKDGILIKEMGASSCENPSGSLSGDFTE